MQTLNILENPTSSFHTFNTLQSNTNVYGQNNTSLLEQLQTTLDLGKLLDIIAM